MEKDGPGWEWQENKRPQDTTMYGQLCGNTCQMHPNVKKTQKWAFEKPKLDNEGRLRGTCFIEPDDEEFKRIMKNAHRKLEIPMPAAPTTLRYIDVVRRTSTTLAVLLDSRVDDYSNVNGDRNSSELWTGFMQFTILSEKHPDGYTWPGGRLTKIQATTRPDHLCPEILSGCQEQLNEEKSSNEPSRNRSLTMRDSWEASIFVIQKMLSSKTPWKTRGKSWNCPWTQPCLVRSRTTSAGNPAAKNPALADQSMHASWKLTNLWESVGKELYWKNMKIALLERGSSRWGITVLCTCFFCAPSNENTGCKSRCGQGVGEARKIASMAKWPKEAQKE